MAVTRDEVICAYRFLLNREPENEAAIQWHQGAADWPQLRDTFMSSEEYRFRHGYLNRWMVAPVFDDTLLLWINMRDKYVSISCAMDAYDPENSALLRKILRPGDTFLDLGANVGWFTLLASSVVGPTGSVHAFEPQPTIADYLERTIALNSLQAGITLHRAGVWHEPGSMVLAWHQDSENHAASHLLPAAAEQTAGSLVQLLTLDSLQLARCDVIKMDIEGAEPKAMEGASRLLAKTRPIILSELNAPQLVSVSDATCGSFIADMNARGYHCLGSRGDCAGQTIAPTDDLADIFTDVLFVPEEKIDWAQRELFGA